MQRRAAALLGLSRGSARRMVALAVLLAPVCASLPPPVQGTEPAQTLRIASWDVSEAPDLMPPPAAASPKTRWRTTFGAERRSAAEDAKAAASAVVIDADAVLLQGVTDGRVLRRLFPARNWRLVVSLQLFRDAEAPLSVTAIAVRVREGLRITGREHLFVSDDEAIAAGASATAVRLTSHGAPVWLLSAALPESCATAPSCPLRNEIAAWKTERGVDLAGLAVGGRHLTAISAALPRPPCVTQSLEMKPAGARDALILGKVASQEGKGCVAVVAAPHG